mmetsp:Transcript_10972/g.30835  ORF Transcript_10972/g.30835 Transcript_10972/m.30835 type:complete len:339 (-) Transcript_10972:3070-4086(-)
MEPDGRALLVDVAIFLLRLGANRHVPDAPGIDLVRCNSKVVNEGQASWALWWFPHLIRYDPIPRISKELSVVRHSPGQLRVVLDHTLRQFPPVLHPIEELTPVFSFIDWSAKEVAPMPQQKTRPDLCTISAEELETHNTHGRESVNRQRPVSLLLVRGALHALLRGAPDVPLRPDGARPLRLLVLHEGAARGRDDAAEGLRRDDPTFGLRIFEQVPHMGRLHHGMVPLSHLVDGQAIGARQLEIQAVQRRIFTSAAFDHDILFGHAQVSIFPDHGQCFHLYLLFCPREAAGARVVVALLLPRHAHGVGHELHRLRLRGVDALLVVLAAQAEEPVLLLR